MDFTFLEDLTGGDNCVCGARPAQARPEVIKYKTVAIYKSGPATSELFSRVKYQTLARNLKLA